MAKHCVKIPVVKTDIVFFQLNEIIHYSDLYFVNMNVM